MEELIVEFSKNIVSKNIILSFIFFFVSQSLQVLFPPYPGDMVLILEGYLSQMAGINIIFVITTAITATFLSSVVLYILGKKEEDKILHSKIVKLLFETDKVVKLRNLFKRFGPLVIIISKFIPGIYSIAVLSAGIFKMNKKKAYISIFIITSIHHISLIILGKILGENWTYIFDKIEVYNRQILFLSIVGLLIYLIIIKLKKFIFK